MKRILGVVVLVLLFAAAAVWFLPSGTGDYADSPDGRYTASASCLAQGTWRGRSRYIELSVVDKASGSRVWELKRDIPQEGAAPDFGDRSMKLVEWAADSAAVTFTLGQDDRIVVPMRR